MMKPTPPIPLKLLFLLALYLAATGSSKAGALANAKAMAAEKTVVKKKPVNRESRQCKKMLQVTEAVLEGTTYSPETLARVASGILDKRLFSKTARGRVNPAGAFSDAESTLEYFYSLGIGDALLTGGFPSDGQPVITKYTNFYVTCDAKNRKVSWSGKFDIGYAWGGESIIDVPSRFLPVQGIFTFNKRHKICSYDMNIARLGLFSATHPFDGSVFQSPSYTQQPINTASAAAGRSAQEQAQGLAIQGLCTLMDQICVGPLQQYNSTEACVHDLTSNKLFGTWDNPDQDTVTCRLLHAKLMPVRPQLHCFHVGPAGLDPVTGKGKCTDKALPELYDTNYLQCPSEDDE